MPSSGIVVGTSVAIFVVGVFVGLVLHAIAGADRFPIEAYVQGAMIAALGSSIAGTLAIVGAFWGGRLGAEGAQEAARITAAAAAAAERRAIVIRLASLSDRHMRQIQAQASRRTELAGQADDSSMPSIDTLEDFREGVLELFVRGAQETGDVGDAMTIIHMQLDEAGYVASRDNGPGGVAPLSERDTTLVGILAETELEMRTDLINSANEDRLVGELKLGGQLPQNYIPNRLNRAIGRLKAAGTLPAGFVLNYGQFALNGTDPEAGSAIGKGSGQ